MLGKCSPTQHATLTQVGECTHHIIYWSIVIQAVEPQIPDMPLTRAIADQVVARASVDSTNALASRLIQSASLTLAAPAISGGCEDIGSPARCDMHVVVADTQTAGHGRLSRRWVDYPGRSLTVSFVTALPTKLVHDSSVSGWLSVIAGLSCLDALRGLFLPATLRGDEVKDEFKLKWPNDIMCDGRKLGGILIELVSLPTQSQDAQIGVIFGCGMNLNIPADELPTDESTSLQLHVGNVASEVVRDELSSRIVTALRRRLGLLVTDQSQAIKSLKCEMEQECWSLGRRVSARLTDGHVIVGIAVRVCDDASLCIRDDTGAVHAVRTADVGVLN